MDPKRIGKTLTKLREDRGESQKDVADAIGVTVMAVRNYENGDRIPNDENKIKLAEHFRKPVTIFFTA